MGTRIALCVVGIVLGLVVGCGDDGQSSPDPDLGVPDSTVPDSTAPDATAPDSAVPDAAPVPGFGERCTPGAAEPCQSGLVCIDLDGQSSTSGYCAAPCTTSKDCSSSAECRIWDGGKSYCGYPCDGANPSCPNGLGCILTSGVWVCSGDPPPQCQNGKLEAGEACDGALLDDVDCTAFGYAGGSLGCSSSCTYDTAGCTGGTPCSLPPRDCTAGSDCAKLEEMLPRTGGTGFLVTTLPFYAWLRHDAFMLVKHAAAAVDCMLPGSWPIGLSDASEQDGSTPKNAGGGLRHPAGTHEHGLDVDIAYFQTGQTDNNPRAVCPHLTSAGLDANHCTAAPDILDVQRSAYFIAKLFEGGIVRVLGVDGQIGPLIEAEAVKLNQDHLIGTRALNILKQRLAWETTDTGQGWFLHHHHHLHLSTVPVYRGN